MWRVSWRAWEERRWCCLCPPAVAVHTFADVADGWQAAKHAHVYRVYSVLAQSGRQHREQVPNMW
eukprot:69969-Chlamydomonas_euryale.AAC.1